MDGLVTDSHSGSFSTYQRKMQSKLLTSWSIMRRYMSAWCYSRKERMEVVPWHKLLEDFNRLWYLRTVILKLHVVEI